VTRAPTAQVGQTGLLSSSSESHRTFPKTRRTVPESRQIIFGSRRMLPESRRLFLEPSSAWFYSRNRPSRFESILRHISISRPKTRYRLAPTISYTQSRTTRGKAKPTIARAGSGRRRLRAILSTASDLTANLLDSTNTMDERSSGLGF